MSVPPAAITQPNKGTIRCRRIIVCSPNNVLPAWAENLYADQYFEVAYSLLAREINVQESWCPDARALEVGRQSEHSGFEREAGGSQRLRPGCATLAARLRLLNTAVSGVRFGELDPCPI